MVFCTKCGKENPNGSKFCYNCGAKLTQTSAVENINTSTNGSGNGNFNYQNTEKSLTNGNKTQKRFKHPLLSIFDATATIFAFLVIIDLIGIFAAMVLLYFTNSQLVYNTLEIMLGSIFLFIVIFLISSWISSWLKGNLRQKTMETGIHAKARIIGVKNLEYDHHEGIRTAELTLEVNSRNNASYQAKSTVKAYASDASIIFRPGKIVPVFIDPEDASQVEVQY